ncbi:DUF2630 family protein [Spirillospora albida]|uniref:DUF2630 family protein n=1 Tax=Spirillospora albida TaxID=58123 RepID=UPI0004C11255|nr:DUF2630 family protein [Spirillospora albida]
MDEKDILDRIQVVVDEEQRLRDLHRQGGLGRADEQRRLHELEVELDQCWDLLRRRRAKRDAGQDPEEVSEVRPAEQVEGYLQ